MSKHISELLHEEYRRVLASDNDFDYIEISAEALFELSKTSYLELNYDSVLTPDMPLQWRGIEMRESHELNGIAFNFLVKQKYPDLCSF